MLVKKIIKSIIFLTISGLLMSVSAFAAYPERPISLIVPFGTGGSTDTNARMLAMELEKILGQRVLVKNISGAAGIIGTKAVSKSKPDGYTFGYLPPAVIVMHPHVKKVPYTLDDFAPVALAVSFPYVLYAKKDSPWGDFNDMVSDMQSKPMEYFVGTTGVGSMPYFAIMSVLATNNIKARTVAFKVDGDAAQAMMGNRIALYASTPQILKQYDVKALASLSVKRDPHMPQVPSIKEFGKEKLPFVHWQAVVAPAGTPMDRITKISNAIKQVSEMASYKKTLSKISMSPDYKNPMETKAFIQSEFDMYKVVCKEVMDSVKANK